MFVGLSAFIALYAQERIGGGTAAGSGVTLGLTISVGGIASPLLGTIADHTSLQTALASLIILPLLSWLLARTLREPRLPDFAGTVPKTTDVQAGR